MLAFETPQGPSRPETALRRTLLTAAISLALPLGLQAQQAESATADEADAVALTPIVVEVSKQPTSELELPATVTVIDREQMDRELARDIQDLVRYVPGVSVADQGSRFGLAGFTIRGMSGNRVAVEVDGVRVSDSFAIGDFSNASRNFIDLDQVKQVEIVRGPSSALFGSDALGGVVSLVTRDPADYLRDGDSFFGASGGYDTVDDGYEVNGTVAGRSGDFSALLRVGTRQYGEIDNGFADPLDAETNSFLGKLVWGQVGQGGLAFTLDHFQGESRTEVDSLETIQDFSPQFGFQYVIDTAHVAGDDETQRDHLGLEQTWNDGIGGLDFLRWRIYGQDSDTNQQTEQDRVTTIMGQSSAVSRQRGFEFDQREMGGELVAGLDFDSGTVQQQLLFGLEYTDTDTEQLRDGIETNLQTGQSSNVVGPDDFPVRDFPNSSTTEYGLFVQDTIAFGDSGVRLVPALRYDRYELDPKLDSIFVEDNPGIDPVSLSEGEWSPKLGLMWDINDQHQVYAQWAEGFRAPPYNDVNVGFTNLQFGYTAIPNPDLESETSEGYEVGYRFAGESAGLQLSLFSNDYENFIESFQSVGFDPVNNLIIFQSVNLTNVEIQGAELAGHWRPALFPDGLKLRFAAAWADGENTDSGQPLNSVEPFNAVLGFDYESVDGNWGWSLLGRGASGRDEVDNSSLEVFQAPGYAVMDLIGYWRPSENFRLRAGVFNLTDREYYDQASLAGVPASSSAVERLRAPGINASLSLDWQW